MSKSHPKGVLHVANTTTRKIQLSDDCFTPRSTHTVSTCPASSICTQSPSCEDITSQSPREYSRPSLTRAYRVKWDFGMIFSIPLRPDDFAQSAGGRELGGCASGARDTEAKFWRKRTRKKEISLYANYCKHLERIMHQDECKTCLLPKTNPRPSIERKENKRIRRQIFVQSFIKESIRIKLKSCSKTAQLQCKIDTASNYHQVPKGPSCDAL